MLLKSLCTATAAAMLFATSLSADTKQITAASKPVETTAAKPAAAPSGTKIVAIKKMMASSGEVEANVEAARQSIKAMTKNSPGINPKFWEELEKRVNHAAFEQMLMGVNDLNYTLEEIQDIANFYESAAGKAFLKKNGKVLSESGQILREYMESNSKELMKKYSQPAPKAGTNKN